jgi:hypothetical protein
MHAVTQVRRERDTVGHGRYTLFTDDIGVALYLRAALDADPAFPVVGAMWGSVMVAHALGQRHPRVLA